MTAFAQSVMIFATVRLYSFSPDNPRKNGRTWLE
jgi:hypothetical protein